MSDRIIWTTYLWLSEAIHELEYEILVAYNSDISDGRYRSDILVPTNQKISFIYYQRVGRQVYKDISLMFSYDLMWDVNKPVY